MFLRSSWEASSISDPARELTLDAYEAEHGVRLHRPMPLAGLPPLRALVPAPRGPGRGPAGAPRAIERARGGFHVHLADGERLRAGRVVIATGPAASPGDPRQFAGLEAPLVQHSSELRELGDFAGPRTAVIGCGQSAIELAALIGEAGQPTSR